MSQDTTATQNSNAAVCRSTTKFDTVLTDLSSCTTTTEKANTKTLAQKISNLSSDLNYLKRNITDTLLTGDSIFGEYGSNDILQSVKQTNVDLEQKKKTIEKEIANNEAVIERSNRDFSDVKKTLPEKPEYSRLHFVEDYTVFFVVTSYLFMVLLCAYLYVMGAEQKWNAFLQVSIVSVFGTLFLGLLSYYLM